MVARHIGAFPLPKDEQTQVLDEYKENGAEAIRQAPAKFHPTAIPAPAPSVEKMASKADEKPAPIAQLYFRSKAGEVTEIRKEIKVEHPDYVGYAEDDRAYIRFMLRAQRQLIVALKSRKWW